MLATQTPQEYRIWKVEGQPVTVEYSRSTLEQIRSELFFRRSGSAIAGLLLGRANDNTVHIEAAEPLPLTDTPEGLAFPSGYDDGSRTAQLQMVGWYRVHDEPGIALTSAEADLHARCFPQPTQLALILRPSQDASARAGIFLRDLDGSLRQKSSYQEFTIEAPSTSVVTTSAAAHPIHHVRTRFLPARIRTLGVTACAVLLSIGAAFVAWRTTSREPAPVATFSAPAKRLVLSPAENAVATVSPDAAPQSMASQENLKLKEELTFQMERNRRLEAFAEILRRKSQKPKPPNRLARLPWLERSVNY